MISLADRSLIIRRARDDDAPALRRLAELEGTHVPAGPMVVAEMGGELRAAMSLDGRIALADPFHPTAELVQVLRHGVDTRAGRQGQPRGWRPSARRIGGLRLAA